MRKILISFIIGAIFLFNTLSVSAKEPDKYTIFDTSMLDSGIIKVNYTSNVVKLKVIIQKDSKKYTYNLNNKGIEESFPLQMGNGEYKVSLFENTVGSSYRYISDDAVRLNLTDANDVYLASSQNINWDADDAAIKKAKELTKGLTNDRDKVEAIYNYIVGNIKYDYEKLKNLKQDYLPDIDSTISSRKGVCYDYASVFAAMLRSSGIPAKLVKGYTPNAKGYHAWNEVYDKNTKSWIIIDTTYDSVMKAGNMKYSMNKKASQYTKSYEY